MSSALDVRDMVVFLTRLRASDFGPSGSTRGACPLATADSAPVAHRTASFLMLSEPELMISTVPYVPR